MRAITISADFLVILNISSRIKMYIKYVKVSVYNQTYI